MGKSNNGIQIITIEVVLFDELAESWGEKAARHLHFDNGFTLGARHEEQLVGLISSYWQELPPPLDKTKELYIDFLEVRPNSRRLGIANNLIHRTVQLAREHQAYQVRSWSSTDKLEAIQMWKSLGFGLCPATTYPKGQAVQGFYVCLVVR